MISHAQFDVCRVVGHRLEGNVALAVILQDSWLADLETRVVAPLTKSKPGYKSERYAPEVLIDGASWIIGVHLSMTLPRRHLGPVVVSLRHEAQKIKYAIDRVFFGV